MGSAIELNDTLQLTEKQGFPSHILERARHLKREIQLADVAGKSFSFQKDDARIFHLEPVRVYLVENIGGKWLFWGHVYIQSQSISQKLVDRSWRGDWITRGTFKIVELYDSTYQELFTRKEAPAAKNFFA